MVTRRLHTWLHTKMSRNVNGGKALRVMVTLVTHDVPNIMTPAPPPYPYLSYILYRGFVCNACNQCRNVNGGAGLRGYTRPVTCV